MIRADTSIATRHDLTVNVVSLQASDYLLGWLELQVKVFVPFYEDAMGDDALHGAVLVPFERGYNVLLIERANADDPMPEPGHAQILPPEDWPITARRPATQH